MSTFKKTQVVMLPTNEKSSIRMYPTGKLFLTNLGDFHEKCKNQHLYFLSDEEIKEGDWVLETLNKVVFQVKGKDNDYKNSTFKKIIATTNTSLKLYESETLANASGFSLKTDDIYLPQPSQSFIEKFVEEYNKGNVITEVMVEYETHYDNMPSEEEMDLPYRAYAELRLKVNPKDNTITIRKVKDSWNRGEIINILDTLLEYPDVLIDAVQNENTKYDGKALLDLLDNL